MTILTPAKVGNILRESVEPPSIFAQRATTIGNWWGVTLPLLPIVLIFTVVATLVRVIASRAGTHYVTRAYVYRCAVFTIPVGRPKYFAGQ